MPSIDVVTGSGAWAPSPMSYNIVMSGASFNYQTISQCYALTHTNTLSSTLPDPQSFCERVATYVLALLNAFNRVSKEPVSSPRIGGDLPSVRVQL